jgi:hypothetical protein
MEIEPRRLKAGLDRQKIRPAIDARRFNALSACIGVHRRLKILPSFGTGARVGSKIAISSDRGAGAGRRLPPS